LYSGSKELLEATKYLSAHKVKAEVGVILGSGLGEAFTDKIEDPVIIPYNSIPFFPVSTVIGHKGQFVFGHINGTRVVTMQGRIHFYEGYSMHKVTFPIRVMNNLGIRYLLISNAAGNLNPKWKHGELMLLEDHINVMPDNPLMGLSRLEKGNIFLDQSEPYPSQLTSKVLAIAKARKIKLHKGVYVANAGPALETKAEYKYLRFIGADAVGMSTVPEVLLANYLKINCIAISVLTNDADPQRNAKVEHSEVVRVASQSSKKLATLFVELIKEL
jgi:purine-nucleoside phosphorylase